MLCYIIVIYFVAICKTNLYCEINEVHIYNIVLSLFSIFNNEICWGNKMMVLRTEHGAHIFFRFVEAICFIERVVISDF